MRLVFLFLAFLYSLDNVQAQDSLTRADSSVFFSGLHQYNSDQITYSAVRGFKAFLGVQQGVALRDGLLRIHGGGVNENSFILNGFNLTTAGSQPAIYLIPEALNDITIHSGNFSVIQNAMGTSLIRSSLRSGGPGFHIQASIQTDKFANRGETYFNTYSYREHNMILQVGGSILDKHRFYIAVENQDIGDARKVFNSGLNFRSLKLFPNDPDSETLDIVYPPGFTPGNSSKRWALNSFFNFDFKPFALDVTALYDWHDFSSLTNPINNYFNKRDFSRRINTMFLGLNLKYKLNNEMQVKGRVGYFRKSSDMFDEYLGNNWMLWADSAAVVQAGGKDIAYLDRWRLASGPYLNYYSFLPNGAIQPYRKSNSDWLEGGLNFTTIFSDHHRFSSGFDWRDMTLRHFDINPYIMQYTDADYASDRNFNAFNSLDDMSAAFFEAYTGNVYGYDRSGNISDDGEFPAKRITHTAAYLNYHYTYDSFLIEAGIRYNYFNNKNVLDPLNDHIYQNYVPEGVGDKKLESWDPRVSFSYIANRDILLNINAGIYTVSPFILWKQTGYEYDYSFENENNANYNQASQLQQFSYFNFALKSSLGRTGELYGNVYWKKEFREWQDDKLAPNLKNPIPTEIKGLDVTFRFFYSASFSPKLQYSYYQAKRPDIIFGPPNADYLSETATLPLVNNQSLRANMEYRFSGTGSEKADQTRMNIILRYDNGHPFVKTYPYVSYTPFADGANTPWTSYVDVRLDKSWYISNRVNLNLFLRINNLFNVKNVINVYPETGSATENGYLKTISESGVSSEYVDFYRKINIDSGENYRSLYGRELYGSPRQIFLGMEVSY